MGPHGTINDRWPNLWKISDFTEFSEVLPNITKTQNRLPATGSENSVMT